METIKLLGDAVWKVLLVSVILGAGLPALFAAGVKSMAYGVGGDAEESHEAGHPVGRVLAYVIFAVVLLVIALGILTIVASGMKKEVSFEHFYPELVNKK